jgi:hypothetical protein
MEKNNLSKILFALSLFSVGYFTLAFTKFFSNLNSNFVNALFELFTLPLIVLQIFLFAFSVYQLFKKQKPLLIYFLVLAFSLSIFIGIAFFD